MLELTEDQWKDLKTLLEDHLKLKPERADVINPILSKTKGLWYKANPWAPAQPPFVFGKKKR